eukprot:TRINITY_DN9249_c0_g1_i3.p1 TRINITY_DN9249_c0_g1~~TRINITY_DN9249_c0_g1_i3.p1  ORF type:complete len:370 (+),score=43.83 TRINITY_DN9249_c0_g1_i3:223-1332(+)
MMRSRRPLLPKVKVTFFRPYVPEAGIQWQPSSGINVLAPDVQATLDDTDLGADEEEDCAVKVAQVNGLIRCLRESNSVVTGLQRECRDHFGRRLRDLKERIDEQRELLGVVSQLALLRGEISIAYIMRLAALQAWRRVSMVGSCADRLTMRVHDTERFASLLRVAGERWFEESAFQSLQACLQAWRSWKQRAAAVAGRSAAAGDCVSRRMDGEGWALQRWVMASWRSYLRHPRSVADYAWGARSDASAEVRLYLRCWSMVTRSSRTVRKVADHAWGARSDASAEVRLYLRCWSTVTRSSRTMRKVADHAWGARSDASDEVRLYLRCWSTVTRSSWTGLYLRCWSMVTCGRWPTMPGGRGVTPVPKSAST